MLKSMTGYGEGAAESADWKIRIEVKTVNQRFLDIAFHTPRLLNAEEAAMRETIKKHVARGKLDLFVTVEDLREGRVNIRVDHKLAMAYHQALNEMSDLLRVARPDDVAVIASYPDVLTVEETASFEGGEPVLVQALTQALPVPRVNGLFLLRHGAPPPFGIIIR